MLYHCSGCKKKKSKKYFHINSTKPDGLNDRCKECQRIHEKILRPNRGEYFKQYAIENKHKLRARFKLQYAVRKGVITKMPCEICGKKKVEAHHEDYSKPLEVRWLCRIHHLKIEAGLIDLPPATLRE